MVRRGAKPIGLTNADSFAKRDPTNVAYTEAHEGKQNSDDIVCEALLSLLLNEEGERVGSKGHESCQWMQWLATHCDWRFVVYTLLPNAIYHSL